MLLASIMKGDTMTPSLVWPNPRSCRGIIACSDSCASGSVRLGQTLHRSRRSVTACVLQAIMLLHELGSGHARLGETIVVHIVPREKSLVVCISLNMMEL